jgi:hypothetical protein
MLFSLLDRNLLPPSSGFSDIVTCYYIHETVMSGLLARIGGIDMCGPTECCFKTSGKVTIESPRPILKDCTKRYLVE